MQHIRMLLVGLVAAGAPLAAAAADRQECFSIVAGRAATACGGVLFAHNEDNALEDAAGFWMFPRANAAGASAYACLAMPGCPESDVLLNEHGVAIASDNCPSREDRPELAGGGIAGPELRHRVAREARTARQGVEIIGALVDRVGYAVSGRTYLIADPREGWLVAVVHGKHWVAARVPDNAVAVIANTYTIGEVDLADSARFLGSRDLVEYATRRGWHDPAKEPFSFEKAYADQNTRVAASNTHRAWRGLARIAAGAVPAPGSAPLPFCVKPASPVTVASLAAVLRDHYEGTPFAAPAGVSPHNGPVRTICVPRTNSASVFQLRASQPAPIGIVWWLCLCQPCSNPFVPLYPWAGPPPAAYGFDAGNAAAPGAPAYRLFGDHARRIDADYEKRIVEARRRLHAIEDATYALQPAVEEAARAAWAANPDRARELLTRFSWGTIGRAVEAAETPQR